MYATSPSPYSSPKVQYKIILLQGFPPPTPYIQQKRTISKANVFTFERNMANLSKIISRQVAYLLKMIHSEKKTVTPLK
mgnify:CR=1 FL=1